MHTNITFDICPTNPAATLAVEIWLNDQQIMTTDHVIQLIPVTVTVDDAEADHLLRIVLKNKTVDDTTVDLDGNIVTDSCLVVNNFKFDDIDVDQLMSEQAVYRHAFNSSQDHFDDKFYWNMGCNGTVTMQFSTPIYIWLLDHM